MARHQKFWDRLAKRFAAAEIKDVEAYEKRLGVIEAALAPDSAVLDMACGSGLMAVRIAPQVRHLTAIDISPKMIAIARDRARAAGVGNIDLAVTSVEDFAAPPASFDVVLAMSILHLLDDPQGAIAKAFTLLKPGGVFISNTHCIASAGWKLKLALRIGLPLGLMPNLQILPKSELLAAHARAGFVIEEEWHPCEKKPVFLVARKPA